MKAYNFNPFPELFTKRLKLRKIEVSDDVRMLEFRSDAVVMKFLDRPLMQNLEEARGLIEQITTDLENNSGIAWGITLTDGNVLIGTIGYWKMNPEHFRSEIGYLLGSEFHGKGYMQEALNAVIQFGFTKLALHSIEANVNPGNVSSINLLEKSGFVREGYFRENYFFEGRFIDSAVYSLINTMANEVP